MKRGAMKNWERLRCYRRGEMKAHRSKNGGVTHGVKSCGGR
jgi:hypothetical protein